MQNSNVVKVETVVAVRESKQDKAIKIYRELMSSPVPPTRKAIIAEFMERIPMTHAGASTYVANVKKLVGAVINDVQTGTTETIQPIVETAEIVELNPVEEIVDIKVIFSKCFCVGEEIVEIATAFTKREARKLQPSDSIVNKFGKVSEILIEGSPEDSDTKSDVKNKFELIRIK